MNRALPGQLLAVVTLTCALLAGTGPAAAGWNGAELIDAGGMEASTPQIALDGSGNAIAVWRQRDGSYFRLYANRWDGSAWDGAAPISAGPWSALEPQIALDGSGNAIAVWRQYHDDDSSYHLYANRWDGNAWGGAAEIYTWATEVYSQRIALDGSGSAIAVWLQSVGGIYRIYADRWDGNTWSGATLINVGAAFPFIHPQIGLDGSGRAITVWGQQDTPYIRIYANRWDGSAWAGAAPIDAGATVALQPQIALEGSGKAITVWRESGRIYANRWDGSTWVGAAEIDPATTGAEYPQIAMDGAGKAIAVWQQYDGSYYRLYASHWDGSAWSGATLIDAGVVDPLTTPQIAMDGSGKAVAVWRQSVGGFGRIYANRWNGSAWTGATLIDAEATDADGPQIVLDASGKAIAVWAKADGATDRIYANRFLPNWTLAVARGGTGAGTVAADSGAIACGSTCSDVYDEDSTVMLTATAVAGSGFSHWDGCTSTAGTECSVTLAADTTVTATFVADTAGGIGALAPWWLLAGGLLLRRRRFS